MVATSVGLVTIGAALVLWAYASKTCASLLGYIELSNSSKIALDRTSQIIRNARRVQSCSATQIVLIGPNGNTNRLTYNSAGQTLIATENGRSTTLLTECTNFQFYVYGRVPFSNTFDLRTNAWVTNTAKVVEMRWTAARRVTGDLGATESQVSSKVVIRNQ